MDEIFDLERFSKKPKAQVIKGDFIDKLHGRTTISFLFTLLILIIFRNTLYSKIQCWYPTHLADAQGDYLTEFCWINSTYLFPEGYSSENYDAYHHNNHPIPYYQYIMFILIGQIFMFYIPSKIWQIISSNSDGYMSKLLDISSTSFSVTSKETQEFIQVFKPISKRNKMKNIDDVSELAGNKIEKKGTLDEETTDLDKNNVTERQFSKKSQNSSLFRRLLKSDSFTDRHIKQRLISSLNPINGVKGLTSKYLLFKFINLTNVIGQFFIFNVIFSGKFIDYGFKYIWKIWNSENPLLLTKSFPIFTLCDFFVYEPNRKIHEYTVQCILPMNVLLEKFYILIWFWLIFLSIVTLWNLLSWIYELTFSPIAKFLHKYLTIQSQMFSRSGKLLLSDLNEDNENDQQTLLSFKSSISKLDIKVIENFQNKYLGIDGLTMLLIIKSVTGDVAFIKLIGVLYNDFYMEETNKLEIKSDV